MLQVFLSIIWSMIEDDLLYRFPYVFFLFVCPSRLLEQDPANDKDAQGISQKVRID